MLRVGCPWRALPSCDGNWHSLYTRVNRGRERGVWWRLLLTLPQSGKAKVNLVVADSTTFKLHRHGGAKGGRTVVASAAAA